VQKQQLHERQAAQENTGYFTAKPVYVFATENSPQIFRSQISSVHYRTFVNNLPGVYFD